MRRRTTTPWTTRVALVAGSAVLGVAVALSAFVGVGPWPLAGGVLAAFGSIAAAWALFERRRRRAAEVLMRSSRTLELFPKDATAAMRPFAAPPARDALPRVPPALETLGAVVTSFGTAIAARVAAYGRGRPERERIAEPKEEVARLSLAPAPPEPGDEATLPA